jgi:uncharacterized protein
MLNRYLIYANPLNQLLILMALTSLSFLLGASIMSIVNHRLGISFEAMQAMQSIPNYLGDLLKWSNVFFLFISLMMPALLFAYLAHPQAALFLGLQSPQKSHHWLWAVTLLLIALPFSSWLEEWGQHISLFKQSKNELDSYTKMANAMLNGKTIIALFANMIAVAICPAIIEELFFRACLQRLLMRFWSATPITMIILTAVLFSAFHGQMSGFIPRVFLGVLLGLAYYFTGSIWLSMLMHFVNNFIAIMMIWLNHNHYLTVDMNHLPPMNIYVALVSVCLTLFFLYYFYKDKAAYNSFETSVNEENKLT